MPRKWVSNTIVLGAHILGITILTYLDYLIPSPSITAFLALLIVLFAICLFDTVRGTGTLWSAYLLTLLLGVPLCMVLSFYPNTTKMLYMALGWVWFYGVFGAPLLTTRGGGRHEEEPN
jgi:putative effector of murein hydrolase